MITNNFVRDLAPNQRSIKCRNDSFFALRLRFNASVRNDKDHQENKENNKTITAHWLPPPSSHVGRLSLNLRKRGPHLGELPLAEAEDSTKITIRVFGPDAELR